MRLYAKLLVGEEAHPGPPLRGLQYKTGHEEQRLGGGNVRPPHNSGRLYGRGDNWLGLKYEQEVGLWR